MEIFPSDSAFQQKKKQNTQHPKFGCKWSFGSIWLQELGVPHSTHVWEHAELC